MVKQIKLFFDYFYYRACDYYRRKEKVGFEDSAVLALSSVQGLLVLNILVYVRIVWEFPLPAGFSKYWLLPLIIVIPLFNYFHYHKPKKYFDLREKWMNEPIAQRKKRGVLIILFDLWLILTIFSYGFIRHIIIGSKSFFGS